MANYQKMYAILCRAIDKVIAPLDQIPLATPQCKVLRAALLEAEEIYITTDSQPLEGEIYILPQPPKSTLRGKENPCCVLLQQGFV